MGLLNNIKQWLGPPDRTIKAGGHQLTISAVDYQRYFAGESDGKGYIESSHADADPDDDVRHFFVEYATGETMLRFVLDDGEPLDFAPDEEIWLPHGQRIAARDYATQFGRRHFRPDDPEQQELLSVFLA